MKIDCSYDKIVDIATLTEHPKNNNRHTPEQIERLAKIIDYQGMRSPIIVSKKSGFITKGHCRLMALNKLGWSQVPVNYQNYETDAQEYADMTADNEIARWSQLDLQAVHLDTKEFLIADIELLGLESFKVIPPAKETNPQPAQQPKFAIAIECNDELDQNDLLEEFRIKGLTCKTIEKY